MLTGPVFLARAAGLRDGGAGRRPDRQRDVHPRHALRAGCVAYDAAKGGLDAATRTLAMEFGRSGVLVNWLAPGFVNTRMSIVDGQSELETDHFREYYQRQGKSPSPGRPSRPRSPPPSRTWYRATTRTSRAPGCSSTGDWR